MAVHFLVALLKFPAHMKKNLFTLALAAGLAILSLAGCESSRSTQSAVAPRGEVVSLPPHERPASENQLLATAAAQPPAPVEGEGWRSLFDGKSLSGWGVTDFGGGGKVEVQKGLLVFWMGEPFVGVNCSNEIPRVNYEVALEAMRVAGSDFFCGLTFPVNDSFASLIVGGWGGSVVGISCLDGADASENETTQFINFETGRWYRIRLRVSEKKIEAWVEQKKVADVVTAGRKISLRFGDIELSKPFGLASWTTSAAFRGIRIRDVNGPAEPVK
jgi:hypothetical protein